MGPSGALRLCASILLDLLTYGFAALGKRLREPRRAAAMPRALPHAEVPADAQITVIISTFNEEGSVASSIRTALVENNVEVVVADGGSTDGTRAAAKTAGARVLDGTFPSRAACLNAGAAAASSDLLVFLHADTRLPRGFGAHVRHALRKPSTSLAAFDLRLEPRDGLRWLSLVEWAANVRARHRSLPWGDQVFCLRRAVFEELGRFPELPMLEDVELVCLARRRGHVHICGGAPVISSSRRWVKFGVLTNTLLNQCVLLGREVGVPVSRMARWYYGATGRKEYD